MPESSRKPIDIAEDLDHQCREWKAERVGWFIMALLVAGTFLGLFGRGIVSGRSVGEPGAPLQVHYIRNERYRGATSLKVQVNPEPGETSVRIVIGREFLANVRITETMPEPESVDAGPDGHTYEFNLDMAGAPADFYFFYEPFTFGGVTTRVGLENSTSYEFRQYFFP